MFCIFSSYNYINEFNMLLTRGDLIKKFEEITISRRAWNDDEVERAALACGKVKVPGGVDHGQSVRVRGEGSVGANGGPNGDLLVEIYIKRHPIFEREYMDVLCEVPITFTQAALGAEIQVPTLDGKVSFTIPEGTQTGKEFVLREVAGNWVVLPVGQAGQESGFRQIGQQIIAPAAQLLHGFHMILRHAGVKLAMVTHSRIDYLQTVKLIQHLADAFRLAGIGQIAGEDGIKTGAYRLHMIGKGQQIIRHRVHNRGRKSCVGGQNRRGQHAGADTHGRQDG